MSEQRPEVARLQSLHKPQQTTLVASIFSSRIVNKMRATSAAVSLALVGAALAAPAPAPYNHNVTWDPTTGEVHVYDKRQTYSNERFTWYNPSVGTGACGGNNGDYDFVSKISLLHR